MDIGSSRAHELIQKLAAKGDDQGVWKPVCEERAAANAALQAARERYLEQLCVLLEAEDLATDAAAAADGPADADSLSAVDAAHQHGSQRPSLEAVRSLDTHLQAAQAMQRLLLPAAEHRPLSQQAPEAAPQCDGSLAHLLGVTPADLRRRYLSNRKAAQQLHAHLLPTLERRLEAQAGALVRALTSADAACGAGCTDTATEASSTVDSDGDTDAGDEAAQLLARVAEKITGVAALEARNVSRLQQYVGSAAQLLQQLRQVQGLLAGMVEQRVLGAQQRLDGAEGEWLAQQVSALRGKLHNLHAVLLGQTYGSSATASALRTVHGLLAQRQAAVRAELVELEARLAAYQQAEADTSNVGSGGGSFREVCRAYGETRVRLTEAERLLHNFQQLEQDTASAF